MFSAKRAPARADIPQNHKGGCAGPPALPHIGAIATGADGVQLVLVYNTAHLGIFLAHRQLNAQPVWLSFFVL